MSDPAQPVVPTTPPVVPPSSKSTQVPPISTPVTPSPPPVTTSKKPDPPTTSQAPPPPVTTTPPAPPPTTSTPPPPVTTPSPSTSSAAPPPETTSTPPSTTSQAPPTTSSKSTTTTPPVVTKSPTPAETSTVVVTSHTTATDLSETLSGTSPTPSPTLNAVSKGSGGGLSQKSKVAIGVVVPIAAIAILALVALFWWKKRRARKEAAEERRKEVEDYAYNPNADPTIPAVGLATDNAYEMREDGSSGYRGWGTTTLAGSTGRKASTTMSGGVAGGAFSDATAPTTRGNGSDVRSGEPLMDGSYSPEGEILGAMGPSAANNRHGDVHRGPSNASSSYSAAGRSEGSDNGMGGVPYGSGGTYYDQYSQNPYQDNPQGGQNQELPGQPVIRDNPARRNTRIENGSHFPQQSAGIAQNF